MNTSDISSELCLGIDFGTTNSCISVFYKNNSIIVQDIDGNDTIPTVIEISSDKKIVGKEAYLRKKIFDKNSDKNIFLVYEIKKLLGKKYSELNKNFINMLAYEIIPDDDDNILIINADNNQKYYPEEIAIHIFMSLKFKAEIFLSKKLNQQISLNNAVISVPAYFNKIQRQIIKNSATSAGLNVIRLINEPTAAAICYGLGKTKTSNDGINIIVFDFGGGTLDVSLLNINDGIYEVLGSCGNNNLGGSDFDTKIMEYCINLFINENNLDYQDFINEIKEDSLQKLKFLSEQAKIALSDNVNTKIKIDNFCFNKNLVVSLGREKFNEICLDLIRIIIKPINDVLELCEISKSEVQEIIMVGGMTRIPIIRYNIERYFGKDVNCSINPDNVVAIGAALHGHMILNNQFIEDKLLLIDRTSLSIGVETCGGIMDVLIPRGTIIPVKKTKKYSTDTDYIDSIRIKIYEGERKLTKDNILIGDFILSGIEKQKRGIPEILITFSIDSDGIISVKAEDLDNPLNKKSIQISGNKQHLTEEQIDDIVKKAKEMDQSDRIDKMKKESYMSIMDSSKKILENISAEHYKLPNRIKEEIIENVNEIILWLNSTDYSEIDLEKYKQILHDFKINYSIYIFQQVEIKQELDASNNDDTKAIEIYDDDINTKKYEEQISYIRKIIDEYDIIQKQLNIFKFMNKNINNFKDSNFDINNLFYLFNQVNEYASDVLLNFFIDKNLDDDKVNDICIKLNELDISFKEQFDLFNEEHNIVNKVINKINEKENILLEQLEIYEKKNDIKIEELSLSENISDINDSYIHDDKFIKSINEKLELIIEFQGYIYKMNSGYSEVDTDKLINILKILDTIY
jgi:heat shock protein 5